MEAIIGLIGVIVGGLLAAEAAGHFELGADGGATVYFGFPRAQEDAAARTREQAEWRRREEDEARRREEEERFFPLLSGAEAPATELLARALLEHGGKLIGGRPRPPGSRGSIAGFQYRGSGHGVT